VNGLHDAHLGPRWEYTKVRIRIEPSDGFDVRFEISRNLSTEQSTYMDAAIMGLLYVILLTESSPLIDIRVIAIGMGEHEVESSPRAFRMAGRDAGQNLFKRHETELLLLRVSCCNPPMRRISSIKGSLSFIQTWAINERRLVPTQKTAYATLHGLFGLRGCEVLNSSLSQLN
jgi:hypothetical protein